VRCRNLLTKKNVKKKKERQNQKNKKKVKAEGISIQKKRKKEYAKQKYTQFNDHAVSICVDSYDENIVRFEVAMDSVGIVHRLHIQKKKEQERRKWRSECGF
jgi:hypothetical protein